jgi:hypothetical protein
MPDQLIERAQGLLFAPSLDHFFRDAGVLRPARVAVRIAGRDLALARILEAIALGPAGRVANDALDRLGARVSDNPRAGMSGVMTPTRSLAPTTRLSSSETGAAARADPSKLTCQVSKKTTKMRGLGSVAAARDSATVTDPVSIAVPLVPAR